MCSCHTNIREIMLEFLRFRWFPRDIAAILDLGRHCVTGAVWREYQVDCSFKQRALFHLLLVCWSPAGVTGYCAYYPVKYFFNRVVQKRSADTPLIVSCTNDIDTKVFFETSVRIEAIVVFFWGAMLYGWLSSFVPVKTTLRRAQ